MVRFLRTRGFPLTFALLVCTMPGASQSSSNGLFKLNHGHTLLDAHNCYPYDGRWADRVDRALHTGFPVAIEQDLAWYVDPATKIGRVVVTHQPKTDGTEPALRDYFFERVRPIVQDALQKGNRESWPLIVVHFDFKDNQAPLLHAVWNLLGEYQDWITTAPKKADPQKLAPLDVRPLLVLTEDPDAQERVFFTDVSVGSKLRLFGSARTHLPQSNNPEDQARLLVSTPPEQLLTDPPSNYRRWWNNSWHVVEEGGQQKAGDWTVDDSARLAALVNHAHKLGYWIRFYTLDGFNQETGRENGWLATYNFGSPEAMRLRWAAALAAGVDVLATDQYEDLRTFMQSHSR